MEKVCPRCGATSAAKKFVESFCADCFAATAQINVPREITVEECKRCGRVRLEKWVEGSEAEVESFITRKCRGAFEAARAKKPLGEGVVSLVFLVRAGPVCAEVERQTLLKRRLVFCRDCGRARGGYYEAIIQVRGERVEKAKQKLLRALSKKTFVAKTVASKEGVDFYVGSKKAAAEALSELGFKPTVSHKLFGVKGGSRIYRTTYCVRT